MEKEENDEMDKAMLSHVIDEADVSGISDLPDLTMDKTGELSAAEDAEKKDDRTVQQILDEAEKKKAKRNVEFAAELVSKMDAVKRKRDALAIVDNEYRTAQSLVEKALVVVNA